MQSSARVGATWAPSLVIRFPTMFCWWTTSRTIGCSCVAPLSSTMGAQEPRLPACLLAVPPRSSHSSAISPSGMFPPVNRGCGEGRTHTHSLSLSLSLSHTHTHTHTHTEREKGGSAGETLCAKVQRGWLSNHQASWQLHAS